MTAPPRNDFADHEQRVALGTIAPVVCDAFRCVDVDCYSCRSHNCDKCGWEYGEHGGAIVCGDDPRCDDEGCLEIARAAKDAAFVRGQIVLVTLRHTETGRRGEARQYEQVRLGEVVITEMPPEAGYVTVRIPGVEGLTDYPAVDVEDAGCGVRRGP